jgi:hypothetical protein
MTMPRLALVSALALSLAACAGRDAHPVAVVTPMDNAMTCEQLQASIIANDTQAASLREENRQAHNQNIAVGVLSVLFLPVGLFALDTSHAQEQEIAALQSRNGYLGGLSSQRCAHSGEAHVS